MLSFKSRLLVLSLALTFSLTLVLAHGTAWAQSREAPTESAPLNTQEVLLPGLSQESSDFALSLFQVLSALEKRFYYDLSPEQKRGIFERIREALNKEVGVIDRHTVIFSQKGAQQ